MTLLRLEALARSVGEENSLYVGNAIGNVLAIAWEGLESLAALINAYNALTVRWILDNYPVKSIKNTKDPWGAKRHAVGGRLVALSTPFGTRGWWYQAWRSEEAWQRYEVPDVAFGHALAVADEAVPGLLTPFLTRRR